MLIGSHTGEATSGPASEAEPAATTRPRWSLNTKSIAVGGALAALVALVVLLSGVLGGWSLVFHRSCLQGKSEATEPFWVPAILVNAPYGGYVSGNASIPPGFIVNGQGFGSSDGLPASNGSVGGVFFHLWLTLAPLTSSTAWGPGANSECTSPWAITAMTDFTGSQVYSGILGNEGNMSDASEPNSYNLSGSPGGSTVYFQNEFVDANSGNISTCGGPAKWLPLVSPEFRLWVPFVVGSGTVIIPYVVPFAGSFHYMFPSNGTWAVDNLSAPGGPGGGWAFNYLGPCT
jgi:hypothetical protein